MTSASLKPSRIAVWICGVRREDQFGSHEESKGPKVYVQLRRSRNQRCEKHRNQQVPLSKGDGAVVPRRRCKKRGTESARAVQTTTRRVARTFIHNNDLGPPQQTARHRQKLPLALREVSSASADRRVERRDRDPPSTRRCRSSGSVYFSGCEVGARLDARGSRSGRGTTRVVGESDAFEDVPQVGVLVLRERVDVGANGSRE